MPFDQMHMPRDLPVFETPATPTNVTVSNLRKARALIDTPEKWCRGLHMCREAMCIEGALNMAERGHPEAVEFYAKSRAWSLLQGDGGGTLWHWNDAPWRTHADVMAAFDKAIALAEAGV